MSLNVTCWAVSKWRSFIYFNHLSRFQPMVEIQFDYKNTINVKFVSEIDQSNRLTLLRFVESSW